MTIGILTHPLIGNYGGILQALALQEILKQMGHSVIILDRRHNLSNIALIIKKLGKFIGIKRFRDPFSKYYKQKFFIENNFKRTNELHNKRSLIRAIKDSNIDCIVIGSDQVWNIDYIKQRDYDYVGAFLKDINVKSFSYAASIGASEWNINYKEIIKINSLFNKFSGLSVREFQTKEILSRLLNRQDIEWVLDPTLLHSSEFYDKYASPRLIKELYIFVYWLGDDKKIPKLSEKYPKHKIIKCKLGDENLNISVEDWLSALKYADIVVTDSFHGCAMSIAYQKHFIPYINKAGGASRLSSLFEAVGLRDKLINPECQEEYIKINKKIQVNKSKSLEFISSSLTIQ